MVKGAGAVPGMDPVPLVEISAIVAEDVGILPPAAAGVVLHKLQADVEAGEQAAPEEEDAAGEDAGAAFLLKLKVEIKTQSTRKYSALYLLCGFAKKALSLKGLKAVFNSQLVTLNRERTH